MRHDNAKNQDRGRHRLQRFALAGALPIQGGPDLFEARFLALLTLSSSNGTQRAATAQSVSRRKHSSRQSTANCRRFTGYRTQRAVYAARSKSYADANDGARERRLGRPNWRSSMANRRLGTRGTLILLLVVLAPAAPGRADIVSAIEDETKKLHALFDDEWQWTLREYPEMATRIGDPRHDDRVTDLAVPAIETRKAHKRDLLKRVREIDRAKLKGQDIVSYDLFLRETEQTVALQRFPSELMPISQMSCVHLSISELPRLAPLRTTKNYDDFLTRLEAYPRYVDQVIELLKRGIAAGWVPPEVALRKVPPQLAKQLAQDVKQSPLYRPFESFPAAIGPDERSRLEARGLEAIKGSIVPTLKRLNQFIVETYLPRCRRDIAAAQLPDGAAYYQALVRLSTTTGLSAPAIHEIGIKEVKRIRAEMIDVIKQAGFSGSFPEFLNRRRAASAGCARTSNRRVDHQSTRQPRRVARWPNPGF